MDDFAYILSSLTVACFCGFIAWRITDYFLSKVGDLGEESL